MRLHAIRQQRHFAPGYTRTFTRVTHTPSKVSDNAGACTCIDDDAATQGADSQRELSACAVRSGAAYSVQHPIFGVYLALGLKDGTMRLLKDPERHQALERWLANKLVADIKATLEAASIKDRLLKELTTELALGVAAKWEGVPPNILKINQEDAAPFLVFGVNNDNEDVLVRNYDEMGSFLSKETQTALARAFET